MGELTKELERRLDKIYKKLGKRKFIFCLIFITLFSYSLSRAIFPYNNVLIWIRLIYALGLSQLLIYKILYDALFSKNN